jgi:hypothetical protein
MEERKDLFKVWKRVNYKETAHMKFAPFAVTRSSNCQRTIGPSACARCHKAVVSESSLCLSTGMACAGSFMHLRIFYLVKEEHSVCISSSRPR